VSGPATPNPLLEAALNLARFHKQHERFYAASPLETALRLQGHARALLALADRWSTVEPSGHRGASPFEGAADLNSEAATALDGVLFMGRGDTLGAADAVQRRPRADGGRGMGQRLHPARRRWLRTLWRTRGARDSARGLPELCVSRRRWSLARPGYRPWGMDSPVDRLSAGDHEEAKAMAGRHFYDWSGPRTPARVGERDAWLPAWYHDSAQFATVHRASFDEVSRVLPSDVLRPARWIDGSALILVAALCHRHVTVQAPDGSTDTLVPYGEMVIGALVGYGRSPRALPVGPRSVFVLHMPVTSHEAYDLGRAVWNFPKFVADMDFREDPQDRSVTLSEGGSQILTVHVRPGGPVLPDNAPFRAYTTKDGTLLRTPMRFSGHVQMRFSRSGGGLSLGDHEVAEGLRRLAIRPMPVVSYSYLNVRILLPSGEPVGTARPYEGLDRADRPLGRLTVTYPSTGPLDLYEHPVDTVGARA
jgi:hypothetical protein